MTLPEHNAPVAFGGRGFSTPVLQPQHARRAARKEERGKSQSLRRRQKVALRHEGVDEEILSLTRFW